MCDDVARSAVDEGRPRGAAGASRASVQTRGGWIGLERWCLATVVDHGVDAPDRTVALATE